MNTTPDLTTPMGRYEYARDLNRRAQAQWDLVWKPWRYLQWRREQKAIKRGIAELRSHL